MNKYTKLKNYNFFLGICNGFPFWKHNSSVIFTTEICSKFYRLKNNAPFFKTLLLMLLFRQKTINIGKQEGIVALYFKF